jgi:hypothetical protein
MIRVYLDRETFLIVDSNSYAIESGRLLLKKKRNDVTHTVAVFTEWYAFIRSDVLQ